MTTFKKKKGKTAATVGFEARTGRVNAGKLNSSKVKCGQSLEQQCSPWLWIFGLSIMCVKIYVKFPSPVDRRTYNTVAVSNAVFGLPG